MTGLDGDERQLPATTRPFVVFACTGCESDTGPDVLDGLRATIRRCPNAILVASPCILGGLTCTARPHGPGVMVLVQLSRAMPGATGPTHLLGPVTDDAGMAALRDWLEGGSGDLSTLPSTLLTAQRRLLYARSTN